MRIRTICFALVLCLAILCITNADSPRPEPAVNPATGTGETAYPPYLHSGEFAFTVADFSLRGRELDYVLFGLGQDVPDNQNLLMRAHALWRNEGIYRIPHELLPIYDSSGGWFYCFSKYHTNQPVVCWAYEFEELGEPQRYDEVYASWSDWLLNYVGVETD
jgi:hypothetical protein